MQANGKYSGFDNSISAGFYIINVSKPPQRKLRVFYHPISFKDDDPYDTRDLQINLGYSHITAHQDVSLSALEPDYAPTHGSTYCHDGL